jgi:hypothetical protein
MTAALRAVSIPVEECLYRAFVSTRAVAADDLNPYREQDPALLAERRAAGAFSNQKIRHGEGCNRGYDNQHINLLFARDMLNAGQFPVSLLEQRGARVTFIHTQDMKILLPDQVWAAFFQQLRLFCGRHAV